MRRKFADRPTAKEKFISRSSKPSKASKPSKPYGGPHGGDRPGGGQPDKPEPPRMTGQSIGPAGMTIQEAKSVPEIVKLGGISTIGPTGTTIGPVGMGGDPTQIVPPPLPDDDEEKKKKLEEDKKKKDEDEAEQKSKTTAKELTKWWAKNTKGRGYKERKNIFTGKMWGSQEAVSAKIADKINKGYYEIVWQKTNLGMTPMVVHKSTGTPVNPYTGNIVDTQTQGAQGGAYQNDMARITGVDPSMAGVFSTEYQRGNGLSISEMKPQHALRLLMKKNPKAFEEFFNLQKSKGFNPFSLSAIGTGMNAFLSKLFGSDALKVGNNLEKHGWGKAIKDKKRGKYSVQLTKEGAQNWSETFNVPDYISPDAIAKDKEKGWLSDLLGTKKFPDQPIDLTNLIDQGGYAERTDLVNPMWSPTDPMSPNFNPNLGSPDFVDPIQPQQVNYGWMPPITPNMDVTGTPSSFTNVGGSLTNYPQFTPEGYNIGAYNPSRDYTGRTTDQRQTGDGGSGGEPTPDPNDPNNPYGNLTFDIYGKPIKKYDYTGGPEQLYLGGGWKKDGTYIGSPWGFKNGGIANFRPYGY